MNMQKLNSYKEWVKERDKLIAQINFLERATPNDVVKLANLKMELVCAFKQIGFINEQTG